MESARATRSLGIFMQLLNLPRIICTTGKPNYSATNPSIIVKGLHKYSVKLVFADAEGIPMTLGKFMVC